MKKILIVVTAIGALVLALGAAGLVYAQTQTPRDPAESPYGGYGPGFGGRGHGPGMMGGWSAGFRGQADDAEYGPLHAYMIDAIAQAFGLTPAEIESAHDEGLTLFALAEEKGFSVEEFRNLIIAARSDALQQALEDGVISQEQADWMQSRMGRMWSGGYGPGSAHCDGTGPQGFGGRGGGFRWNSQP